MSETDAERGDEGIYEPRFVAALFDEMSASYGITNYLSSFGFCERWRRQCVEAARLAPGMRVLDLMAGMGECWRFLQRAMQARGHVIGIDLSQEMCRRALHNRARVAGLQVHVTRGDALRSALPDGSADCVVSTFGLKTFSPAQLRRFAGELFRVLRPGGSFALVEIAVPRARLLRLPYLFYLRRVIPIVGRLFLGNPDNYRMLAVYTERFHDGAQVASALRDAGLEVRVQELFFGCARRLVGDKPAPAQAGPGAAPVAPTPRARS